MSEPEDVELALRGFDAVVAEYVDHRMLGKLYSAEDVEGIIRKRLASAKLPKAERPPLSDADVDRIAHRTADVLAARMIGSRAKDKNDAD